jgi:nucleoside-diphosphate-sugar epimerase
MSQIRTVLITGGTGFVGRTAAPLLKQAGYAVTLAARTPVNADFPTVALDLAAPASLDALRRERFDAIVHLGARVSLGDEPDADFFDVNVLASGLLARAAREWGAHFVFASTAVVHGARTPLIDEHSTLNADTAYARSKLLAEKLVAASGASHCVLRIGGIFGAGGPSHLGLNRAIAGAVEGRAPALVLPGAATRNYIYVDDVALTLIEVLRHRLGGTHLLAGSEVSSMKEMLGAVCDILLPGTAPAAQPGPPARNQVIQPSVSLPPTRSFRAALGAIRGATP